MWTREQLVAEALTWAGTPYHRRAMIKGVGCDCATLLLACYSAGGFIGRDATDFNIFTDDWWANTKLDEKFEAEQYYRRVIKFAKFLSEQVGYRSSKIEPGNLILMRAARSSLYNHGAIVIKWPMIIHSVNPATIVVDATTSPMWSNRITALFDPWLKAADEEALLVR